MQHVRDRARRPGGGGLAGAAPAPTLASADIFPGRGQAPVLSGHTEPPSGTFPPSLPPSAAPLLVCVGIGPAQRPQGPEGGTLSRGGHGRVINVKTLKPFRHLDLKLGGIASTVGI